MNNHTFEERVRNAGYKPDFAYFDRLAPGEFYRFGPQKAHWMTKHSDGYRICGDWSEKLPRVSEGITTKKYGWIDKKKYSAVPVDSLYLKNKGVLEMQSQLPGLLVATDHLSIPLYDIHGTLLTYQKIFNNGEKKFLNSHPVKGGHYIIGDLKDAERIIFCEGLATGCSLFLCTSQITIVTFGSSNLTRVIEKFRELFPTLSFLIAGDKGKGEESARKAASQFECHLAIPDFNGEGNESYNDFNDLHQILGITEVQNQIEKGFESPPHQSTFPIILLEDCFDEEDVVYKKFRVTIGDTQKEIWIKGEDFNDRKKIEGIVKKYNLFYDKEQTHQIITYMGRTSVSKSRLMNNECGWRENGDFYLPPLNKPCINTHYKPFSRKGNLAEFKKAIFPIAEKNSLIIFILSYGFLPLFLKDFKLPNFGIHLYGESSTGKTTLLKLAASLWGAPVEQWNGTTIGFEDVAYRYKDTLFCLDEINQINSDNLYHLLYILANGGGRIRFRSKEIFASRPPFRINYLSTGESSIKDKIGEEFTGGHFVRILDINCHRSNDSLNGIFENSLDSMQDITQLEAIIDAHQNVSINHMLENFEEAKKIFSEINIPNPYRGQPGRIKNAFIAIEKAGIVATKIGCLPLLDITTSIQRIFEGLNLTDNSSHEIEIAKRRLYTLLVEGEFFFYQGKTFERFPYKIKGYKAGNQFYITIPTLKNEVCENINYKSVKEKLIKDKIIEESQVYKINHRPYRAHKVNEGWFEKYEPD